MKKILFILMMLVCGFASAQVSFIGQATTVQRDGLTIPVGRYAVLYNSTTGQFERWNGSSWERWTAGVTTGDITDGTIDILDLDAALQTSVGLADTSTQPGDNISTLTNDSGFLSSLNGVTSANITDGTIDELDLDASVNASLDLADSAVQSADIDTFAELDAIVADKSLVNTADAQTLTNKTIAFGSNTLSNVLSTNTAQSITGAKTFGYGQILLSGFTSGTLNLVPADAVASGTASIPSGTLITQTSTNTLTNKTLTSPVINTGIIGDVTNGGNITSTNYLVGATATQTLTNKTISGASNTITNIGSSSILNDAINSNKIQNGTIDILDTDAGIQASLGLADTALQSADIDTYTELNTTVADVTLTHNGLIDTSAEIAAIVTDETGSGSLVFSNSPTLVTPALGTPSSATLTNATGLPGTGIVAGSIEADRLESTNSPTDGYFPSYDSASGGVTWESISGTDSGSGYTFNTVSTDNTYLTDTEVTAAGSSTGKKIWNRVTATLDSVWLHKDSLSLQGNPFIIQNWGADSVVVRKGAGTNFYIADSAAVYSRNGVILKQRHPLTVIKMDASSFFLQGNFSPLLNETTVTDMVSASSHDAEESDTGVVTLNSSDIELVWTPDGTTYSQKVGLLFDGLNIPQGATITSAKIQFETKELQTGASPELVIYGEDSDNAAVFTTATNNVSGRTKTTASVSWSGIAAWGTLNERGANQLTPELKTIVQEIVNRAGYTSASNIAFIIEDTTTSNRRTAKAYDSYPTEAAEITITYQN